MRPNATKSEYERLVEAKNAAAANHQARTLSLRKRIAAALVQNPEAALAAAERTLSNTRAARQEWSKREWEQLLRTRTIPEIANLLVEPPDQLALLMDSHPFGGVLGRNGR